MMHSSLLAVFESSQGREEETKERLAHHVFCRMTHMD